MKTRTVNNLERILHKGLVSLAFAAPAFFSACFNDATPPPLPEARQIVYESRWRLDKSIITLMDEDGQNRKALTDSLEYPIITSISPDGNSIFYTNNYEHVPNIIQIKLQDDQVMSKAVVGENRYNGPEKVSVSRDGNRIVYAKNSPVRTTPRYSVIMERELTAGAETQLTPTVEQVFFHAPAFSPTEDRIFFVAEPEHWISPDEQTDLYVMDSDGTNRVKIGTCPGSVFVQNAEFSPDGQMIAYAALQAGAQVPEEPRRSIFVMAKDGAGRRAVNGIYDADQSFSWGSGSDRIFFVTYAPNYDHNNRLLCADIRSGGIEEFSSAPGYYESVSASPDGKRLAYGFSLEGVDHSRNDTLVMDLATKTATNITQDAWWSTSHAWRP